MRTTILIAAMALSLAPASVAAAAGSGPRMARYVDTFTSHVPGTGTARHASTDIVNPDDPSAKPPAARHIVVELAPGSRMDTTAVTRCTATDAQLVAQGTGACPPESVLGQGEVDVDTGFPDPNRYLYNDFFFINAPDQLILLARNRSNGANVPVRGKVEGNTLDVSLPPLPGTPPDGGADTFEIINMADASSVRDGRRVHYLTTPPSCPPSGLWTNRVTDTFADGVTQSFTATTPCERASAQPRREARRRSGHSRVRRR